MSTNEVIKRLILRLSVILLPVSVGFIMVSLTLAMLIDLHFPRFSISLFSITCGGILWYSGMVFKKRLRFFFAAILLSLTGLFLLLIDVGLVHLPLPGVWPFLMLFIGISLLISGSVVYRRALAVYVVPAVAFASLGSIFLLFSTDIIPGSITSFVLFWIPFLILPTIISVIIWLTRKRLDTRSVDE